MLYLIASPIGNLGDITLRVLETIRQCDYLLAEDTLRSRVLLKHHGIDKRLVSYHQFNEKEREAQVLSDLQSGSNIGLITDAGTPGISDPGARLIDLCRLHSISFTSLPGPSALAVAISLAGDIGDTLQFLGFLPKKTSERIAKIEEAFNYPGASFFFESPHRVIKTLEALQSNGGEHTLICFRELTKLHEETLKGTAEELLAHFTDRPPRGEFVFCLKPHPKIPCFDELTLEEHVAQFEEEGYTTKEAIKAVAQARGISKRIVYQAVHNGE